MRVQRHTPGPWKIGVRAAKYQAIPANDEERRLLEEIKATHFEALSVGSSMGQVAIIPLDESSEANAHLIEAAPDLLAFAARIARMTQDGEEIGGREFVMGNDDAVDTLNGLIDEARRIVAEAESEAV